MIDESSVSKIVSGPGEKLPKKLQVIQKKALDFILKFKGTLVGGLLSLQLLAILLITNYNLEIKLRYPTFSLRAVNLVLFIGILVSSYLFSFLIKENATQTIIAWLKSNLLAIFGFLYFLTIESRIYVLILISILTILSFLLNQDLFGQDKKPFYLIFAASFLFTLQSFALINFLEEDKTQFRNFPDSIVSQILSFDKTIWLIFCAGVVSLWCVASFKLKTVSKNLLFGLIFFAFSLQTLVAINSLNFDFFLYWQKTLLFVVFLDFIYQPFYTISNQNTDDKYTPKLVVSSFYHSILMLSIFFIPIILR